MVPDDVLLNFFRESRKTLLQLDCPSALQNETWTPQHCRMCLLDKQRSVLNSIISQYNQKTPENEQISSDDMQRRLAGISKESVSSDLATAMREHDEAARLALCKLVLYSETHREIQNQELQSNGRLSRPKLMEYLALCQTAMKLHVVQKHITDGSPLFEDMKEEERPAVTAMSLPQKRLESVQQILARSVGLHPTLVTSELTRIFFDPTTAANNEYTNDEECRQTFRRLISEMQTIVANASLNGTNLSDKDKGGVTRVVSVQYSEVEDGSTHAPPRQLTMELPEEEQKRQIRLASQAKALQESLLEELNSLSPEKRKERLAHAKQVNDEFLREVMALPPGPERVQLLRSVDPEKSRLMTMYKLWLSVHGEEET
eukprot:scaffold1203_cov117-Cylindrotheca_fusiformis.AAC.15